MIVKKLPKEAKVITQAVLTRGGRIRQGWRAPGVGCEPGVGTPRYYETFHYPGALNFQQIIKLPPGKPDWA